MKSRNLDIGLYITAGLLILACYTLIYLDNFLFFHSLAEMFSIVIGCSIFVITWNSRYFMTNRYFTYLGIPFLFIGILETLHMFTYHGMPFFQEHGTDLPTQIWIASRYLFAVSLFVAPLVMNYRINVNIMFTIFFLVTVTIILLIFNDLFPVCYIDEKQGLSLFKKVSEYIISLIFAGSILLVMKRRDSFDRRVLFFLVSSIIFAIFSELCFTLYINVYSFSNFAGHLFKIVSFLLLYRAIIVTGLKNPYSILFRELNQNRDEYRSLFNNMIDGFARHRIITDDNGKPVDYVFNEVNTAFEELTGLKRDDIIGKKVTEVIPGIENDPADWIGLYGTIALSGGSIRFENYSADLKKWFSVAAYSTKKGRFTTVFQDITERKQVEKMLERKVKERTKELEERNQELQDFSFIASHDLQEPLRKIRTFGNMVSEMIENRSYDRIVDYVSRMRDSAERMQNLLNSLLAYSRVTASVRSFDKTDLSTVLKEALSNLEILINEKRAVIETAPLPAVEADPSQIVQVFQNLIVNAIKFTPPGEDPHIRIYGETEDDEILRIVVEDRGIGFDTRYTSKIFMPFQRLNGKSEYPGTGMGLAICRKIIERHGGEISATSRIGRGSAFMFTLPLKHSH